MRIMGGLWPTAGRMAIFLPDRIDKAKLCGHPPGSSAAFVFWHIVPVFFSPPRRRAPKMNCARMEIELHSPRSSEIPALDRYGGADSGGRVAFGGAPPPHPPLILPRGFP